MSRRFAVSEFAACATVAAMTAAGSFNLDDLVEHAKNCPTCQAITGALMKPIADAITVGPPETSKDKEQDIC